MSFEPIENYGVIGNMQSTALVGMNGSIDFLCYPEFDSPTVFAALLDDKNGSIWERLHYDRSDPNHVVLTTTDSDTWGGASGHTYTRRPDGLTDIDVVVVRDGKNLKGRLLGLVVGTIGKDVLEKAFRNSVKAIEARNGTTREAGAA
jgi:trehalase-like protein